MLNDNFKLFAAIVGALVGIMGLSLTILSVMAKIWSNGIKKVMQSKYSEVSIKTAGLFTAIEDFKKLILMRFDDLKNSIQEIKDDMMIEDEKLQDQIDALRKELLKLREKAENEKEWTHDKYNDFKGKIDYIENKLKYHVSDEQRHANRRAVSTMSNRPA